MSDPPVNRIARDLLAPDDNTRRFHSGQNYQAGIPTDPELSEEEAALLEADRARIKVPVSRPRWGYDEDGQPIEAPPAGLLFDEETGTVAPMPPPEELAPEPIEERAPADAPSVPPPPPTTTPKSSTTSGTSTTSSATPSITSDAGQAG